MTVYYVGPGGSDANSGLSWVNRKLTLNGAEDVPIAAGDTVYVGPGTYREMLTVDVSGTAGNIITYIGDYTGANTSGVRGEIRITGSDDDLTATRANGIVLSSKNYRTFRGFSIDTVTDRCISLTTPTYVTIEMCILDRGIICQGASQSNVTIKDCYIDHYISSSAVQFTHSSTVDNCAHVVQSCIIYGSPNFGQGIISTRVGGITVKNCTVKNAYTGIEVGTALTGGQLLTVNNCIVAYCGTGLKATTTAEFSENYNDIYSNGTARTNVTAGANSSTRAPLFDNRWFFEAVLGSGVLVTPWDLAAYSMLVEYNSGTGAPSTDMRGAVATGIYREWGALERNPALLIAGGGGPMIRGV